MKNFQFTIVSLILIFIFKHSNSQLDIREVYFPEVGWTIDVPKHSNYSDSLQIERLLKELKESSKEEIGVDINLEGQKTLFVTRNGTYNFFGSTIAVYDSTEFKTWDDFYKESISVLIQIVKNQEPGIKMIDTVSSKVYIDGLLFDKFCFKSQYPDYNLELQNCWYCRFHDNYIFSINIAYKDDNIGLQYINIINSSKFDK